MDNETIVADAAPFFEPEDGEEYLQAKDERLVERAFEKANYGKGVCDHTVITFGTFDLCHVGHIRILKRASELGNRLVVGVSSDALNTRKKNKPSVYTQEDRIEIIGALRCVDEVFLEDSLEAKPDYIRKYGAKTLAMGDDWKGKFDGMPCKVCYLPRTPYISTTAVLEGITNTSGKQ